MTVNIYSATVSGFLRDSSDNEALNEGNIYIENTTVGASSNIDGYFVISAVPKGNYKIIAQYVGYQKFEKKIAIYSESQSIKLNIKLKPDAQMLDKIVAEVEQDADIEDKVQNIRISEMKVNTRKIKTVTTFIQPDLFRVIKTMPGVVSTSDFSTGLFVRGGQDDHNLILYDEITVYNPSHMFGIFSTFMTDALRDTKLTKSAYSAEYGGRLGSVLDVRSRDGNKEKFEGDISLSAFAGETILSGPLLDGGFLIAGRRTYLDPILKYLDYPGYYFWEGQGQVYQDFGVDNRLIYSTYMGNDELDYDDISFKMKWGNRTHSLRWRHIFSPKLFSTFMAAYSSFFVDVNMGDEIHSLNDITDYTFKNSYNYYASNDLKFKTGLELKSFKCNYETEFNDEKTMDIDPGSQINSSAFIEMSKTWLNVFTLKPGLRINYFNGLKPGKKLLIAPRLSMKYMLDYKNSINLSGGRYYQSMFTVKSETQPLQVVNSWFSLDESVEAGYSDNFVLGYNNRSQIWDDEYKFTVETYFKTMKNLQSWAEERASMDDVIDDMVISESFKSGNAYAYGIEFIVEKNYGKLNGNLSYTYGKVKKKLDGKKEEFDPYWDTPHNLKAVLAYNFSKKFNIGSNIAFSSGKPYTEIIGFKNTILENGIEKVEQIYGDYNKARYPDYFRCDISANYIWFFKNNQELLLNVSIINATNNANIQSYSFEEKEDAEGNLFMERKPFEMFPMIPSIRLSYSF